MSTTPQPGVSPLDYRSPQVKKTKRPNWILRIGVTIAVIIGAISVLLPSFCQPRETANRAKCASNLHQIALAISLYTQDHGGKYPSSFATLLQNEQLPPAVFVCPSSNDEAAEGADTATAAANMTTQSHHLSYVYLGNGLTTLTVSDQSLIAYELPENHQGDGMNMLFGDGHVEWEAMPVAKALIAKAIAATQP